MCIRDRTYAVGDVVMTITTDESGHASTGSDVLPYGTYEVRESATNESMLLTWQGETVQVRQNGHSVSVTAVDEVCLLYTSSFNHERIRSFPFDSSFRRHPINQNPAKEAKVFGG